MGSVMRCQRGRLFDIRLFADKGVAVGFLKQPHRVPCSLLKVCTQACTQNLTGNGQILKTMAYAHT